MKQRDYSTTKNEICRNCQGEGVIELPAERIGHNRFSEPRTELCTVCEGSGIVEKTKRIEVTIKPKNNSYGKD